MKMVKSLLLGTAAGMVAISGAQAADLPVKAKPVEYVKVCSIYGSGFYYIPGTDTCLKIGGYVRMDVGFNAGGSHGPYINGANARDTRERQDYQTRVRGIFSFDTRTQTEYGTLRLYMRGGWELNSGDPNYRGIQYFDRGFIQFAGFTFGKTTSFFTFYGNALNYVTLAGGGHSDAGLNLIAYTAQFAGGFSASISLEDAQHHRAGLHDAAPGGTNLPIGGLPGGVGAPFYGDYRGQQWPDIVANLRVDQPWGSAQLSGVVRDVSGMYVGPNSVANPAGPEEIGWAVQGGVKFNLPWAQGDELYLQAVYSRGATQYLGESPFVHTAGQFAMYSGGVPVSAGGNGSVGLAYLLDGVFDASGLALVEGWAVLGAFQHYWTPSLRTSVFGQYTQIDYGAAGDKICNGPALSGGFNGIAAGNCNFDFAVYQIGTRTIWSPVRNLDIGVELLYTKLDQSFDGLGILSASGARPAGTYNLTDQDTFSGTLRFQRNFWP